MPEPVISLTYEDNQVRDRLNQLTDLMGDLTPVMKEVGETLLLNTDQRWQQETGPDGTPWKPNTPYTIALKKAQNRILKVLQSTGMGRASITYKAEKDRVTVGTNRKYLAKHQLGQEGLPKREFLGVSKEDLKEILAIFDEYIANPESIDNGSGSN